MWAGAARYSLSSHDKKKLYASLSVINHCPPFKPFPTDEMLLAFRHFPGKYLDKLHLLFDQFESS